MTNDAASEIEQASVVQHVELVGSRDWFLQSIIEVVIAHGVEFGITLVVGGSVVSGILISGKKFFEEIGNATLAMSEIEGDIQSVLGNGWKQYTSIYDAPKNAPDDWQGPPTGFIHLKDARFFAPGQQPIPTRQGLLWRGKLEAIDGFSFGNFSAD